MWEAKDIEYAVYIESEWLAHLTIYTGPRYGSINLQTAL